MQLERKRDDFERRGVGVAAVSFDTVDTLRHFAERAGVSFPLLSDPDSEIIRAFGLLNTEVPADHRFYGIPRPGEFWIGPDGVVQATYFEEDYSDRFTAGSVLVRQLGSDAGAAAAEIETDQLTLRSWASDVIVRGGNRLTLGLDIDLPEKMHVYAPGVENYIPISWTIETASGLTVYEPEYPQPETLHLPAINETAPVYEGSFRALRDVMVGQPDDVEPLLDEEGFLVIKGSFRYQACDDKVCYLPRTLPLEWRLEFEAHDRTRGPEELRRPEPR